MAAGGGGLATPPVTIPDAEVVAILLNAIRGWRTDTPGALLTVGISGAQGSGKSTLAATLAGRLAEEGVATASLSLDDLYLTRAGRHALAATVHPLFATRGVPGTHDVALGLATLGALASGEAAPIPRFDKAADDRAPIASWPRAPQHCQVVLFEGWCLGACPHAEAALDPPINALEEVEDPAGIWRRHANAALAGDYQHLFARADRLFFLAAPDWDVVAQWREQQEAELRAAAGANAPGVMNPAQVARFIQHYERLTRHMLVELPGRADAVIRLGEDRGVLGIDHARRISATVRRS